MRFLIDAQLPPGLVSLFESEGHQARHVADAGLLNASDRRIAAHAARSGEVVVTKDEDLALLQRVTNPAPRVVWLRVGNTTNRALRRRLRPHLAEILSALEAGEDLVEIR